MRIKWFVMQRRYTAAQWKKVTVSQFCSTGALLFLLGLECVFFFFFLPFCHRSLNNRNSRWSFFVQVCSCCSRHVCSHFPGFTIQREHGTDYTSGDQELLVVSSAAPTNSFTMFLARLNLCKRQFSKRKTHKRHLN